VKAFLKKSWIVALAAGAVLPVFGDAPKAAPPKPAPARSVFVMPTSARDGRDPFFPESSRPYEDSATVTNHPQVANLTVKGLSVEHGHAMVIINNHTFAVGDEGDVLTGGKRVHLRLVDIRAGTAVIEVNGSRRELRIATK
jgi:hypothetical protein